MIWVLLGQNETKEPTMSHTKRNRANTAMITGALRKAGLKAARLNRRERRSGYSVSLVSGSPDALLTWWDYEDLDNGAECFEQAV